MSKMGRRPICLACGDLDASCPICEPIRAGILHREARRDEAVEWIKRNLSQKYLGETRIVSPSTPHEFELMVMAIMAYARETSVESSPEPLKCERFRCIEWEKTNA